MRPRAPALHPIDVVAAILVGFNLAIAQPLLAVFGANAEFFVARDSESSEIVGLALLVTLVIPLSIAGLVLLARRIHRAIGTVVAWVALSVLFGAVALLFLDRVLGGAAIWIVVALVAGGLITAALQGSAAFRTVLRFGALIPLVVLGLFLFLSPVSKLVFTRSVETSDVSAPRDPAPVVMILLDELPTASLMDRSGDIDEHLFPNLAGLARSSTWFRNTTTVHAFTTEAVPAMLDGRYPEPDLLPTHADHPGNLFELLGPHYEFHVTEPITRLCAPVFCDRESRGSLSARWGSLLSDAAIVAAHIVTPEDLADRLPPIGDAWGGFTQAEGLEDALDRIRNLRSGQGAFAGTIDPRDSFRTFNRSIEPRRESALYFLHALVPHRPWRYLPSGQEYPQTEPIPGAVGRRWGSDRWLVTQAYQRHLLQVAAVDRLIGSVIETLKSKRIFNRSLVIVAADHGISFRPGSPRRSMSRATIGEVAHVPLFIKRPFQTRGRVDDRPAQTIDILPSLGDVLGIEDLPDLDGRSLFARAADERIERKVLLHGELVDIPVTDTEKMQVVRTKYATFPETREGSLDPFGISSGAGGLIGRKLEELVLDEDAQLDAAVEAWDLYARVGSDDDPFPALLSGSLGSDGPAQQLAIGVNGRIVAMTRTYNDDGERLFYVMVPPAAFDRPDDAVELFAVSDRGPRPLLVPIQVRGR